MEEETKEVWVGWESSVFRALKSTQPAIFSHEYRKMSDEWWIPNRFDLLKAVPAKSALNQAYGCTPWETSPAKHVSIKEHHLMRLILPKKKRIRRDKDKILGFRRGDITTSNEIMRTCVRECACENEYCAKALRRRHPVEVLDSRNQITSSLRARLKSLNILEQCVAQCAFVLWKCLHFSHVLQVARNMAAINVEQFALCRMCLTFWIGISISQKMCQPLDCAS